MLINMHANTRRMLRPFKDNPKKRRLTYAVSVRINRSAKAGEQLSEKMSKVPCRFLELLLTACLRKTSFCDKAGIYLNHISQSLIISLDGKPEVFDGFY